MIIGYAQFLRGKTAQTAAPRATPSFTIAAWSGPTRQAATSGRQSSPSCRKKTLYLLCLKPLPCTCAQPAQWYYEVHRMVLLAPRQWAPAQQPASTIRWCTQVHSRLSLGKGLIRSRLAVPDICLISVCIVISCRSVAPLRAVRSSVRPRASLGLADAGAALCARRSRRSPSAIIRQTSRVANRVDAACSFLATASLAEPRQAALTGESIETT